MPGHCPPCGPAGVPASRGLHFLQTCFTSISQNRKGGDATMQIARHYQQISTTKVLIVQSLMFHVFFIIVAMYSLMIYNVHNLEYQEVT